MAEEESSSSDEENATCSADKLYVVVGAPETIANPRLRLVKKLLGKDFNGLKKKIFKKLDLSTNKLDNFELLTYDDKAVTVIDEDVIDELQSLQKVYVCEKNSNEYSINSTNIHNNNSNNSNNNISNSTNDSNNINNNADELDPIEKQRFS